MKNWNNIGRVSVEKRDTGSIKHYDSLVEALHVIGLRSIDGVNEEGFIRRHWMMLGPSSYWSCTGDYFLIRDELGLVIPRWKVVEVFNEIPRDKYGWPIRHRLYRHYANFKFRDGPVPGRGGYRGGSRGAKKLWQLLKADHNDKHDEELKEYKFKRRDYGDKFSDFVCWDRYDGDHGDYGQRNWKNYRKHQWKD